jgi:CubicO group peptidase (beta-lactamase class C family)
VDESTRPNSDTDRSTGYGYIWWIAHDRRLFRTDFGPGSYSARGYGEELILIAPAHDMVFARLADSYVCDRLRDLPARIMVTHRNCIDETRMAGGITSAVSTSPSHVARPPLLEKSRMRAQSSARVTPPAATP